jgi:SAM-dependent methyltransferase
MSKSIEQVVREKYGAVAESTLSSEHSGVRSVAQAFGYTPEELSSIPAEANMGLSCGNPTATANLRPGEVVVDLGSGGGLDVFLAAQKVGPSGKAIGIDMTPEMLERARANAKRQGLSNVEFHEATIENLPLPDASVDCVISNCVINLASDKQAVFREVSRVLKPGGRVAVSDIALKKPLPPEIGNDLLAYVGCIAGAIPIEEYRTGLLAAGFAQVEIVDSGADLNAYAQIEGQVGCCGAEMASEAEPVPIGAVSCCTPAAADSSACCTPAKGVAEGEPCCTSEEKAAASDAGARCCSPVEPGRPELITRLAELTRRYDVNDYAASVRVYAVKPS